MKNLFLLLIFLIGCKSGDQQDSSSSESTDSISANTQSVSDGNSFSDGQDDAVEFVNDEIGGDPFAGDLTSILKSVGQFDVLKKSFQNLHDSTAIDTLMTFNFGTSTIEYFQGSANGFIISANIESDQVEFKRGISIGMPDVEFNSLFDEVRGRNDLQIVTITTMEGLAQTEFHFTNHKLAVIRYQSYFD
jgi:hypothetical protein